MQSSDSDLGVEIYSLHAVCVNGERRLWNATLVRALSDALGPQCAEKESAIEWFKRYNGDLKMVGSFAWICLELDLDDVMDEIAALATSGKQSRVRFDPRSKRSFYDLEVEAA
jgi:hypothetical protein